MKDGYLSTLDQVYVMRTESHVHDDVNEYHTMQLKKVALFFCLRRVCYMYINDHTLKRVL